MIQAKDLRIGNMVDTDEGVKGFTPSMMFGMYNTEVLSVEQFDSRYRPIPLTEEWLIKFGFVLHGGSNKFAHKEDFWELENEENGLGWYCCHLECSVKYVHQLQNLYHALTGQELEIKK